MPRLAIPTTSHVHEQVDATWKALMDANDPRQPEVLLRNGGVLVSVERGTDGQARLEQYGSDRLAYRIDHVVEFWKQNGQGSVPLTQPPRNVVNMLLSLSASDYPDAMVVDRVVDVPVLSADGERLNTQSGYDKRSRIFYDPAPGLEGVAPRDSDAIENIRWAQDLLLGELLGDFDFASQADRANALGLLLLPFVREYIGDGPTPLHGIFAPEVGSGKTTVAHAALYPGCGSVPAQAAPSSNGSDDEWKKTITASMLAGTPAILFDNLTGVLDSGALAGALTSGHWQDRILGKSEMTTSLPIRNAWVATGNNLGLANDQVDRTVPIFLDPGEIPARHRPASEFRHPDLLRWASENRRELVSAALTLVQHWQRGRADLDGFGEFYRDEEATRHVGVRTKGSFTRWSQVIGGILDAADVEGFNDPDNDDRMRAESKDEDGQAADFLRAWHEALGQEGREFRTVRELCQTPEHPLNAALPDDLSGVVGERFSERLTAWLRKQKGRRLGASPKYQLLSNDEQGRARRWVVFRR